ARTEGLACTVPPSLTADGAAGDAIGIDAGALAAGPPSASGAGEGAAARAAAGAAAGAAATAPPPAVSSLISTLPSPTLSPRLTSTSLTTPACEDGTSIVALSDSSVAMASSTLMVSPTFTNSSMTGT